MTWFIILIGIAVFAVVAFLVISNVVENREKVELINPRKNPSSNHFRAERWNNPDLSPNKGDYVKLWRKPGTSIINIYAPGSVGGMGLLGRLENHKIADHLSKEGLYNAEIKSFNERYLFLDIELSNETMADVRQQSEDNLKEKLLKPYKPKTDWNLSFNMIPGFDPKKEIQLKCLTVEEIVSHEGSIHDALWIEDKSGNRLSEKTYFEYDKLLRTLRALITGLDIKIKSIKKKGNQFELILGV